MSGRKGVIFTEEHKQRISKALTGKPKSASHRAKMKLINLGRKQSAEVREINRQAQLRRYKLHPAPSGHKLPDSTREKMRLARLAWMQANSDKAGWRLMSHNQRETWPERMFRRLLVVNLGLIEDRDFVQEYHVGRYTIDFAFIKQKVAVEVDGSQHLEPDNVQHDIVRDQTLNDKGWEVIRIPAKKILDIQHLIPSETEDERMQKPRIYLGGAIRDSKEEDIKWREHVINTLRHRATFLNPLGGKHYNKDTSLWTIAGQTMDANFIVKHDKNMVQSCDIVLANLSSLAEGYPTIGTLIEIGCAWGLGKLIYVILPENYKGHENLAMYQLHPFLEQVSAARFTSVNGAIQFLRGYLPVLNGISPTYVDVEKEHE